MHDVKASLGGSAAGAQDHVDTSHRPSCASGQADPGSGCSRGPRGSLRPSPGVVLVEGSELCKKTLICMWVHLSWA